MGNTIIKTLGILAVTMALCTPAIAGVTDSYQNGKYRVEIESNGSSLPTWYHNGYTYIEGIRNQRYAIRVYNNSPGRIEAVLTVDGRDVISGKAGNYKKNRGYVISPYDSILIEGFRTSWSNVAEFYFTSAGNSYSSQMGTPQNTGVIGVAIFEEKTRRRVKPSPIIMAPQNNIGTGYNKKIRRSRSVISSAPSKSMGGYADYDESQNEQQIGTGYGNQKYSSTSKTSFKRRSRNPQGRMAIYYDNRAGLIAKGIIPTPIPRPQPCPMPFPQNNDQQFAPPPPAYYRK